MNKEVKTEFSVSDMFKSQFKKLFKKYKTLIDDVEEMKAEWLKDPNIGDKLGAGLRKVRINIRAKKQGKQGGGRIITHELLLHEKEGDISSIYLVAIYDKAEYDTVDIEVIKKYVKELRGE